MKKHLHFLFIVIVFLETLTIKAQDANKLNVGDQAPNIVLPTSGAAIQSFAFPYQNKAVLVFFWSSSVSKSKENLFKYSRIFSRYSSYEYKSFDGFDMISVAVQSDKNSWVYDLKKYNMLEMNNCIALKGYQDVFIKPYKITETPSSFLINEMGKIVLVNPDIRTLVSYLNEKKNAEASTDVQTIISCKILFGKDVLTPLKNEKVTFVTMRGDTTNKVSTDDNGNLLLENFNTSANYHVNIIPSAQVAFDDRLYLASETGAILSEIFMADKGYQYKLIDADMSFLRPMRVVNHAKPKTETNTPKTPDKKVAPPKGKTPPKKK